MHPEKESGSRRRQLLGFQIVRESSGSFLADSLFSDGTVGWICGSFVFRCFSCGVCADLLFVKCFECVGLVLESVLVPALFGFLEDRCA